MLTGVFVKSVLRPVQAGELHGRHGVARARPAAGDRHRVPAPRPGADADLAPQRAPRVLPQPARGLAARAAGGATAAPGADLRLGSAHARRRHHPPRRPGRPGGAGAARPVVGPGAGPDRGRRRRPELRRGDGAAWACTPTRRSRRAWSATRSPGTVAEVGDGVTTHAVGDRVMAGTRFGGHAEQVVVAADRGHPAARRAVLRAGRRRSPSTTRPPGRRWSATATLQPGERVLIHAAAGGVGIAATQIAKRIGAPRSGAPPRPRKHDAIRGFGVDQPLDYRTAGWEHGPRRRST